MSKLVIVLLLAGFIMSNDDDEVEDTFTELLEKYKEAQRKRDRGENHGEANTSTRWYYQDVDVMDALTGKIRTIEGGIRTFSNSYIECEQATAHPDDVFDFPMPKGWLYDTFGNDGKMRYFFDTGVEEHWVLPNVYCKKNVLTAVSWMRSHKKMSHDDNEGMHMRFRDSRPTLPLYRGMSLEKYHNKDRGGVYCNWRGWLHDPDSSSKYQRHFRRLFDTNRGSEKFTFVNVYCNSDNTVRFFAKSVGGDSPQTDDLWYPFEYRNEYERYIDKGVGIRYKYPSVGCNWTGWLFGDMTAKQWKDPGDKDKEKYSYEKYYVTDYRAKLNEKPWMNGRVINPFCSKGEKDIVGIVTNLRVYCFYTDTSFTVGGKRYELKDRCSDLQPDE